MKTLFVAMGVLMGTLAILGFVVSKEYGESAQFFVLSVLCFKASEEVK